METHVVQAIRLDYTHYPFPRSIFDRSMAGFREHGIFDSSAQMDTMAVDHYMMGISSDGTHAEGGFHDMCR